MSNDLEVTLEANPTSAEATKFRDFADAGVNRVSVGLQALNDTDLKMLGRLHTAKEGLAAYDLARSVFPRVSFDLIYARQHQSLGDWQAELEEALALTPDHLSLYQLTIEDGTAFKRRHDAGGLSGLPSENLAADHYELTQDLCGAAGLPAYEVSNHARRGYEARHNLIYWRSGDYAGIGPGAHGRLTLPNGRFATVAEPAPGLWLNHVEMSGRGDIVTEPLDSHDRQVELLMMGLRTLDGVSLDRMHGNSDLFNNKINDLCDLGLLKRDGSMLRASESGRLLLNTVLHELTACL